VLGGESVPRLGDRLPNRSGGAFYARSETGEPRAGADLPQTRRQPLRRRPEGVGGRGGREPAAADGQQDGLPGPLRVPAQDVRPKRQWVLAWVAVPQRELLRTIYAHRATNRHVCRRVGPGTATPGEVMGLPCTLARRRNCRRWIAVGHPDRAR